VTQAMDCTGCPAKGVAHGGQIGQELLRLAQRARVEGKLSEADWRKLPTTPQGMVNLLMGQDVEKSLIEALLETYG
jgi:hypothetical protein